MTSDAPRAGDVVIARVKRGSVGLFIMTASPDHCLYTPCDTMSQALERARKVAVMSSVDVWRHTSNKTLERIASYREDRFDELDVHEAARRD